MWQRTSAVEAEQWRWKVKLLSRKGAAAKAGRLKWDGGAKTQQFRESPYI